ncbi:MAG: thioredoxin family protein [Runella zeae]
MKKLLLLSCLLFQLSVSAQQINFFTNDIRQAFNMARAQGKLVFVEVYSKTCEHCAAFEPIFKEKAVADFYNKNFISYKLEVTSPDVRNFLTPKRLYAPSLPLFLFFDGNENLLHFAMSNPTAAETIKHAQNALNPSVRAATFRSRYASGERSDNFLIDMAMYCRVVCDTTLNIKIMEEYARRKTPAQYADKNNWLAISKLVMDVENPMSKYLINNMGAYKAKYGAKEVKLVAENLIMGSLYSGRGAKYDAAKIQQMRQYLIKIGIEPSAANARTLLPEVNYYFAKRQTAQATARAEDYLNNAKAQLPDYMYIIKLFNNRASDASFVPTARKWVNKALTLTATNSPDAQELKAELAKINARK